MQPLARVGGGILHARMMTNAPENLKMRFVGRLLWTAKVDVILTKIARARAVLDNGASG